MRIDHLVVILVGLAAGTLGTAAAWQEASPFLNAGLDGAEELNALVDGSLATGLSSDTMRGYAEACLASVPRLDARFLDQDRAAALEAACSGRIGQLSDASPVNSYLWYARARLALDTGQWDELDRSLINGRASGPNEYWIASRRLVLALRARQNLGPEAVEQFNNDIRMLAQSAKGSRLLAAHYTLTPDLRPVFTDVIDTLGEDPKYMFLANVRHYVEQRGGRL